MHINFKCSYRKSAYLSYTTLEQNLAFLEHWSNNLHLNRRSWRKLQSQAVPRLNFRVTTKFSRVGNPAVWSNWSLSLGSQGAWTPRSSVEHLARD